MVDTASDLYKKFFEVNTNFYKSLGHIIVFALIPWTIIGILGALYDSDILINIFVVFLFIIPIVLVLAVVIFAVRLFRMNKEIKNKLSEEEQMLLLTQTLDRQKIFFKKLFILCLIISLVFWPFTVITGIFSLVDTSVSSILIVTAIIATALTIRFGWEYNLRFITRKLVLKLRKR